MPYIQNEYRCIQNEYTYTQNEYRVYSKLLQKYYKYYIYTTKDITIWSYCASAITQK